MLYTEVMVVVPVPTVCYTARLWLWCQYQRYATHQGYGCGASTNVMLHTKVMVVVPVPTVCYTPRLWLWCQYQRYATHQSYGCGALSTIRPVSNWFITEAPKQGMKLLKFLGRHL